MPLPLTTEAFANLKKPLSQCGFDRESQKYLIYTGKYFLADLAIIRESMLDHYFGDDAPGTAGDVEAVRAILRAHGLDFGSLAQNSRYSGGFKLQDCAGTLYRAIRERLQKLYNSLEVIENHVEVSNLAVALLDGLDLDSAGWSELEDMLAEVGLKPKMKIEELFTPPLTETQIELLAHDCYKQKFDQALQDWVTERTEMMPSMIHVLVTLLAIEPEERPPELVAWFEGHKIPIEPLSAEDLKRAIKATR